MEFCNQDLKLIVAHPDDEILFFSSIVNLAEKIVICFEGSSSTEVTEGRKSLFLHYPYKNIELLGLIEADVYDALSFSNRQIIREGISVEKNADEYLKNFDKLLIKLRAILNKGDLVFTHNPWGEYGHPEHIQVFAAVRTLSAELDLKVYVNGYVSDKTFGLMSNRYNILSSESFLKNPNSELGQNIKNLYIENNCWTWSNDYVWPSSEIFYRVLEVNELENEYFKNSSHPPLSVLTNRFKHSRLKHLLSKYLPEDIKSFIKKASKIK